MKHLFTTLLCVLFLAPAFGRVLTVSNDPGDPAQYPTIQSAVALANAGDTIAIGASPNLYNDLTNPNRVIVLTKRIVLLGPGTNPTSGKRADIEFLLLDSTSAGSARGSIIKGLYVSGSIEVRVPDIVFTDNYIPGGSQISLASYPPDNAHDVLIANNIISRYIAYAPTFAHNIIITNNIITGSVSGVNASTLVTNNLFYGPAGYGFGISSTGYANTNALITNNIFYGIAPRGIDANSTVYNSIFSNNITFGTPNDTLPYWTNTGSGNLISVNPQLRRVAGAGFDFQQDYRPASGSPCINAGTDGKDIGITGGSMPWYPQLSANGILPTVGLDILNPVVTPTGSLQVRITGKKSR